MPRDDAICRKILETWLRNWGYRAIVADDGAKAWDILQQENLSIGGTVVARDTTKAKKILATADAALDQAKNAGRNRTVVG